MKNMIQKVTALALFVLLFGLASAAEQEQQILKQYEAVSAALVADNLSQAQAAAKELARAAQAVDKEELANGARQVAQSGDLAAARQHFATVTGKAIPVAATSDDEYFLFECPMVEDGRWIRSEREVANPYMGQRMPKCGELVETISAETASHGRGRTGGGMQMEGMEGMEGMRGMGGMMSMMQMMHECHAQCQAVQDAATETVPQLQEARQSEDPDELRAALDEALEATSGHMEECMAMMMGNGDDEPGEERPGMRGPPSRR